MNILTTREENTDSPCGIVTKYWDGEAWVTDAKSASHLDTDEAMSIQATYKERGYPVVIEEVVV